MTRRRGSGLRQPAGKTARKKIRGGNAENMGFQIRLQPVGHLFTAALVNRLNHIRHQCHHRRGRHQNLRTRFPAQHDPQQMFAGVFRQNKHRIFVIITPLSHHQTRRRYMRMGAQGKYHRQQRQGLLRFAPRQQHRYRSRAVGADTHLWPQIDRQLAFGNHRAPSDSIASSRALPPRKKSRRFTGLTGRAGFGAPTSPSTASGSGSFPAQTLVISGSSSKVSAA